jgi:hypothetical protein
MAVVLDRFVGRDDIILFSVDTWRCSILFGNSYGNISLLVPFFHISVSFDNLFQGICPVDDWLDLPRLGELP